MARKRTPICVEAPKGQLDPEDSLEIVADLVADLGFLLVDPDDVAIEGDSIGRTMGTA